MRKTTTDSSNKLPNFKSLLFGMLLGIFVTSLLIFTFATSEITLRFPNRYTQRAQSQTQAQQTQVQQAQAATAAPTENQALSQTNLAATTPVEPQEPRFDFYTELSKNSPEPLAPTQNKENPDLKSNPKPINGYLVQAGGSFKRNVDADAIKAKLSLNGFEAKVEPIKLIDGEQRYRILLGPVKTEKNAKLLQNQLKGLDIESVLVTTFAEEKRTSGNEA